MSYPNPEQAAVPSHVDGTLLVLAPAGTEKTRLMADRLARNQGVCASRPHSSSFFLILPHSSSFFLILPHSSSFFLILPHSSSFDLRPSTFDLRPSTFDLRPSTFDLRPSTFDFKTFDLPPLQLHPNNK